MDTQQRVFYQKLSLKKIMKKMENKHLFYVDPGNIFFILIAKFFGNQRIRI
jgi:hypothetical protein